MTDQPEMFRKEIDLAKLSKKAQKVLRKFDKLVDYYRKTDVRQIHISQEDYRLLSFEMGKSEQSLGDRCYKGFVLTSV